LIQKSHPSKISLLYNVYFGGGTVFGPSVLLLWSVMTTLCGSTVLVRFWVLLRCSVLLIFCPTFPILRGCCDCMVLFFIYGSVGRLCVCTRRHLLSRFWAFLLCFAVGCYNICCFLKNRMTTKDLIKSVHANFVHKRLVDQVRSYII